MDEVRREGRVDPEMGTLPHRSERELDEMGKAAGMHSTQILLGETEVKEGWAGAGRLTDNKGEEEKVQPPTVLKENADKR